MIERREGYYNKKSVIIFSLLFIPFLLGLIGFNLLIQYSTTDFFLASLIELLKYFSLPINSFLVFMLCGIGIPFVLAWRKFFIYMSPKNKIKYSVPEVEGKILQFLTENKGKSLSRLVLIRKVKFPGIMKEFTAILNQLWQEDKIKREFQDYPRYSAV
jgi:hypothetical protein